MVARAVEGGIALDDRLLPPGVAQHLFVAAVDEDRTALETVQGGR
jgi:DtxR family Mn-dependent transcriptional regulator